MSRRAARRGVRRARRRSWRTWRRPGPSTRRARCPVTPSRSAAGLATLRAADAAVYAALDAQRRPARHMLDKALAAEGVPHRVQFAGNLLQRVLHRRRGARLRGRAGRRHVALPGVLPRAARTRRVRAAQRVRGVVRLRRARRRRLRACSRRRCRRPRRRGRGWRRRRPSVTRTVVHLLRHGEVHNPDGILYGRLPGFRLSDAGQAPGRRRRRRRSPTPTSPRSSPRRCSARRRPPPPSPRRTACRIVDRRAAHRGGQHVRGPTRRGRRRRAARRPQHWPQLRDPFTPVLGRAVPAHRAPHARGAVHGRATLAEGHEARVRLAPAADLDAAPVRRGQAAVARPAAAAVLAGLADLARLRRRGAHAAGLQRARGRSAPTATGA